MSGGEPNGTLPALELSEIERPESVSGAVARQLLARLFSGGVQPGQRLPSERELATQLAVGRSAIREGVRALALLGVLEVRPGSGTYLRAHTSDLLPDVIEWGLLLGDQVLDQMVEARVILEVELARLTAGRRDDALLEHLDQALAAMRAAENVEQFTTADLDFHLHIAEGSGNTVLTGVLRNIRALLAVWIRRVREAQTSDELYRQHVKIAAAIRDQDPDAAAHAMREHMQSVTATLRRTLGDDEAPEDPDALALPLDPVLPEN